MSPGEVAVAASRLGLSAELAALIPKRSLPDSLGEDPSLAMAAGVHAAEGVLLGLGSKERFAARVLAFHTVLRELGAEGGLLASIDKCLVGLESECVDGGDPYCGLSPEEELAMRTDWSLQFARIAELDMPASCLTASSEAELLIRSGSVVATLTALAQLATGHPKARDLFQARIGAIEDMKRAHSQRGKTPSGALETFLQQVDPSSSPQALAQAGEVLLAGLFPPTPPGRGKGQP